MYNWVLMYNSEKIMQKYINTIDNTNNNLLQ